MNDERWDQITTLIKNKFKVEDHSTADLNPGKSEYYVFEGPLGKMKLERVIRPKLIDRKVYSSTRIGGISREEKIYSEHEEVSFIKVYKWDADQQDWLEIELDSLIS